MANKPKPLDIHQQELINIVKLAHENLALARKTRAAELERRIGEGVLQIELSTTRAIQAINDDAETTIRTLKQRAITSTEKQTHRFRMEMDASLAAHESALDEALIAAYNGSVPVRRIALDGFGNRYDGGVQQLLAKLRADNRIGTRVGHQRNTSEPADVTVVEFPKPLDMDAILEERTALEAPKFTRTKPIELVAPDENGIDGVVADAVRLDFDSRDPWFLSIRANARPGTEHLRATFCTLYLHPFSGELVAFESQELGVTLWDHPVARWAKEHPDEALAGFSAALDSAQE